MRVLIADDDLLVRHALHLALTETHHEILEAADGLEAMSTLRSQPIECLILDLLMPRMSGYDVLRWLEESPQFADLPVIVLSAFICDVQELLEHPNVCTVLEKPLYVDQLHEALADCDQTVQLSA